MMSNKLVLAGIIGSLTAVLALAAMFPEAATAQMMQHQQMQQSQGSNTHGVMKHSIFDANGMSMVQDVSISGVAIAGNNEVSVNLTYSGNASAPSITVVAITNHEQMKSMMEGGSGGGHSGGMDGSSMGGMQGMMGGHGNSVGAMGSNGSGMMQGTHSLDMGMRESQTGSAVLQSGWQTGGNTVTIRLDGNASAYEASDICVMVFPHLA